MKAALYHGPGDVRIEQVPDPPDPGERMVRLRIEMVALCGTDASQFRHPTMIPLVQPHASSGHCGPLVIGHEVVGTIEAIGQGVKALHVGQRVVPGSGWWCGDCPPCLAGRPNICEHYYLAGIHANGGMAERAIYPAKMCLPVPAGCSIEAAALAQPCAIAIHAIDRGRIQTEHVVAIFGVGGIGSLILAVLQAQGKNNQRNIAVDCTEEALSTAARLGIAHTFDSRICDPTARIHQYTNGWGCDVVIDATGVPGAIKQALSAVRRGGRLLQVGIPTIPVELMMDALVMQEKEIVGTNGQICSTDLAQALDLLTTTSLAERIGYHVIELDHLVEQGLIPLVEHRAPAKILVKIP